MARKQEAYAIDDLVVTANGMYFEIKTGWQHILVPMTPETARAVALIFGQGVPFRTGWTQGDGPYWTPFNSEGKRVEPIEVGVLKGVNILNMLALAPENVHASEPTGNGSDTISESVPSIRTQ